MSYFMSQDIQATTLHCSIGLVEYRLKAWPLRSTFGLLFKLKDKAHD